MKWAQHEIADVFRTLQADRQGLTSDDAELRKKEHGLNRPVRNKGRATWRIFLEQFTSPLMVILLCAVAVGALLGEWIDSAVISVAILVNGLLGFIEEYRADASLRALEKYLPIMTRVRRNGKAVEVAGEDIVPGDILLLRAGDKVVADARVFSVTHLETNEAALTGESMPVIKSAEAIRSNGKDEYHGNMVFAGTVVAEGMGEAVVVETGEHTQIGRISSMVTEVASQKTPLQQQIARLARVLTAIVIVATIVVMVIGAMRGYAFIDLLNTGIAIAVSAVPEGLAVATTAILALGMQRLLRKQVLVRKLVATETLGSVSVICVDKTGTLTTGHMSVRELLLAPDITYDQGLIRAAFATNLSYSGDHIGTSPTEKAIAEYLQSHASGEFTRVEFVPFTSATKYSMSEFEVGGARYAAQVGAPEVLLEQADISDKVSAWAHETLQVQTESGRRVVALVMGLMEQGKVAHRALAAIAVIEDPLRPNVKEGVDRARAAGLHPIMITGDHPETASSIARELGIATSESEMVTGKELDLINDTALAQRIHDIHVFARVRPDHKLRIVRALQKEGEVVAMMGDGVNDAPALKAADIGISVGSATEVAKEASDMVLLEQAFTRIIDAVFEGRVMFDNIRKVIVFLLVTSLSELFIIGGALVFNLPLPLSPIQLLWINLVTDSLPAFALGFEAGEEAVWSEGPRSKNASLLNAKWMMLFFVSGVLNAVVLLGLYAWNLNAGVPLEVAQTTIFVALASIAILFIFSARILRVSILRTNPLRNPAIIIAVCVSIVLLLAPFSTQISRVLFEITTVSHVLWGQVAVVTVLAVLFLDFLKTRVMHKPSARV